MGATQAGNEQISSSDLLKDAETWIKEINRWRKIGEKLYRAEELIQRAGSYGNQAYKELKVKTKHPQAINTILATRRIAVVELERILKTMPDALRPRIQKALRQFRQAEKKQKKQKSQNLLKKLTTVSVL